MNSLPLAVYYNEYFGGKLVPLNQEHVHCQSLCIYFKFVSRCRTFRNVLTKIKIYAIDLLKDQFPKNIVHIYLLTVKEILSTILFVSFWISYMYIFLVLVKICPYSTIIQGYSEHVFFYIFMLTSKTVSLLILKFYLVW